MAKSLKTGKPFAPSTPNTSERYEAQQRNGYINKIVYFKGADFDTVE